ncbi:hypothetical protein EON65_26915 [archaeon]|nr:MAG: hypothetical protein EON65_26915 [archaeon]
MSSKVSVMVVNIDNYMSKLDVHDDLETIHQISKQSPVSCPVIRIFGCTPLGQRACLHIHGVSRVSSYYID